MRIGSGYDIHRIEKGDGLKLASYFIPCPYRFIAHSDGDVVLHSLIDALLGSFAKRDIGYHFPPSNEKFKNIASSILLKETLKIINEPIKIINIDINIIAEEPKLSSYIDNLREALAKLLSCDIGKISIKAKTNEGCGCIGQKEAIACFTTLLLEN